MPPFVFDPRKTNERQLRAFLARKLPGKEIESEETPREYSLRGKPLVQWRQPFFISFQFVGCMLKSIVLVTAFLLLVGWLLCGVTPLASLPEIAKALPVLLLFLFAFAWLVREQYAIFDDGAVIQQNGKTFRFRWESVRHYTLLKNYPNHHLLSVSFDLIDSNWRLGATFLLIPDLMLDTRDVRHARVLALLREKLPDKAVELRRPKNIIEITEADKLRAL